jgi:hypothetical protein
MDQTTMTEFMWWIRDIAVWVNNQLEYPKKRDFKKLPW